jgi:epoxide hydrolase-like predicted phosphatase
MSIRAVIFDLGGVVIGSPLHAVAAYERELGLARNAVNHVVVRSGPTGAWSRLERGELGLEEFYPLFEADCGAHEVVIDAREMMRRVAEIAVPRPAMLDAIRRLRSGGLKVAALTNNWITEDEGTGALRALFDVFVESIAVGLRKPDPRIYQLVCRELDVEPAEAVFLDDIGSNLKTARELGMTTIKVDEPGAALAELERVVGIALG